MIGPLYYPYMASIVGRKRGTATYYYLVESGRAAAVHWDLPGGGGAEPAGRPVLEGSAGGLVEDHRRAPVHQDPGRGAGSPSVLGRDARRNRTADGGDLGENRGADRGRIRDRLLVSGPRHDELRHLHRHREREGSDRAARQGQAEAH